MTGKPSAKKINDSNRMIVFLTARKQHQSVSKAQEEFTREMQRQNRAGVSSKDIQLKPIVTKNGVSKKTHKRNRFIVSWIAYKNGEDAEEADKEYTRRIQREYRARKLKELRQKTES